MSVRPRKHFPALAVLAAPLALVPVSSVAADEPVPQECFTTALTPEQVALGETSEVTCSPASLLSSLARLGSVTLATHYSGSGGTGDSLTVTGDSCVGAKIAFSASDPWNNQIRSTRNLACANAKHYANGDWTGDNEVASGTFGSLTTLSASINTRVSSVAYGN